MTALALLDQEAVDYPSHRTLHEVQYRVELLRDRFKALRVDRTMPVADIGVGCGLTTELLASQFLDLTCIDISSARLAEVRALLAYADTGCVKTLVGDAATLPLSSFAFGHVFMTGLLEHCPDPEKVLANVKPSLVPGGRVHILVNNAGSLHRHLGVALGLIDDVRSLCEADLVQGHYRTYTPDQLLFQVEDAGFDIDHLDLHYMKPLPTRLMEKLPPEINRAFAELGRKFRQFAAYIYLEAVAS